ncbi:Putative CSC1/OSCA1-like, 7TM region, 10TM putative phosphate transporter, extracellular tail [Colletotrichum destructivum]|uniref:CSC1/OSCA1-like, 7TM region, 10TM putative phosphate transporter, extracellular tail n=1 Tax=Colletotrichum destructivum TaxID=34406 RepID=A0AAX4IAD9_9PEZI|nr:Putative CSC1/OSCA1-like, 7TM region, 10TM putative phosphate transporter, extracellular tail [Colletotrichum destructivum]
MSATPTATPSGSASLTETLASSLASSLSTALSATISSTLSSNGTISSSASPTTSETSPPASPSPVSLPSDRYQGITLVAFLTALATGISVFAVQIIAFLLLRNKIARIFKPKSYLVPERERTESPPSTPWSLISTLIHYDDRDIIKKCGLDAYFFLRYLRTLLTIFIPIAVIVIPILIPLNYSDGVGHDLIDDAKNETNGTSSDPVRLMARAGKSASGDTDNEPTGLDTLAWGNISRTHTGRFWAHLILALLVIIWVCTVFFFELRVYIKVRQDYLTSAEHRLRASATTILVNSIPSKWLTEEALLGLFDVFPGQIRNIWLNRDLTTLLEKIQLRENIHLRLEAAETELVKAAKRKQLKRKKKEDKLSRKQANTKGPTRQEEALRRQREDADAKKRAEAGLGISSGEHEDVPHDISAIIDDKHKNPESRRSSTSSSSSDNGNRPESRGFGLGLIGDGISKVGKGLLGGVGKAQQNIKEFSDDVEETVETTNGFAMLHPSDRPRKVQILAEGERPGTVESARVTADQADPSANTETQKTHSRNASAVSQETTDQNHKRSYEPFGNGNTVRKVSNLDHMYDQEKRKFWQFWKAPAGGYASPVPQGFEGGEYPFGQSKDKTTWQKIKAYIPFTGGDSQAPVEYPESNTIGAEYKNILDDDAEWRKWIKEKNRPMHRLPRWGFPDWLAWLTFGPKVDTIYWCRSELARLNVEIDDDQAHPERYPLMNSAFIQFNHQVSAHMACQSLMHHVPKHMSPRINEVSPKDVIWDNMALKWWHESIRSGVVTVVIAAMAFFWAIPIAFTASIANIDGLVGQFPWLAWIKKDPVEKVAGAVAGVLPAILLALLLLIVPLILEQLALFRGVKTGSQKAEFVQRFYFVFLFIQVFLVVSIASFFAASVDELWANLETLSNVGEILNILARNLPRASNYFFSYMLLQALSVSSGTLLQIGGLVTWYLLARILDTTARDKWKRNTTLSTIAWGQFFPVYTNFACIALVYSVIAPLISLFAVLTFGLLWFAQRYSMLYVTRFETDTGGVLYPRAINQTFTGLYVMEACLAGLFFITVDENDNSAATPQGVIMLVTLGLTAIYQISLNTSFSPLFRYLPITVEDEAVLRDEAFQRAQNRRLGLPNDDDDDEFTDEKTPMANGDGSGAEPPGIELQRMENEGPKRKPSTMRRVKNVGHWAKREGKNLRSKTWNVGAAPVHTAAEYRRQQRNKDLEAQRALGEALYGGFHDEIEDLTPAERDALVKNAFKHYALRARAPAVWIPRDDIGVSDDEIRRTKEYSEHIWISNEGTALDSKIRVVYGANPPDFSEIDIINL